MKRTLAIVFALCVAPILANAATYYVAKTGSDGNTCTQAQSQGTPKLTITSGLGCLTPGSTLQVGTGTYAEEFNYSGPSGTSWSAPITIQAIPGNTPVIQPASGAQRVFTFTGTAQYVVVDGFVLDGINVATDVIKIDVATAGHIRVKNSELKNAKANGFYSPTGSSGNELLNLNVHDNATFNFNPYGHGIYIGGPNNLVDGCTIHDQRTGVSPSGGSDGIQLYNSGGGADNNILRNNRIYNNSSFGIQATHGTGTLIYNNVVYGNGAGGNVPGGIETDFSETSVGIYNNTIYANTNCGVCIGAGTSNAVVENNIVYLNTGTNITNSGSGTTQTTNLAGTNPLFVNPSAFDFHLQLGSPAIGAGTNLSSIFTTDKDGVLRLSTGAWNIGAYQFVPSGAIMAPPQNLRIVQ